MCDAKSTLLRSAFCKSFSICNFSSTAIWAIHTFLQRGVSVKYHHSLSNCRHLSISQTNLVPFRKKLVSWCIWNLFPRNVCSIFSRIELKIAIFFGPLIVWNVITVKDKFHYLAFFSWNCYKITEIEFDWFSIN